MSKLIVWFTLWWIVEGGALAQRVPPVALTPYVDERVELLSILARLAEYEEYSGRQHVAYITAIDAHFAPYKDHPAVAYMKQVRTQRNIGYDAVMSYAVQLSGAPDWTPLSPFICQLPDARWTVVDADKLAGLIQAFYRDARCADFFRQQQARYRQAESRFAAIARQVDVPWFARFYGQAPTQTFKLVLGLSNSGGNFGPHFRQPDGNETVYAIMGTWLADSTGEARYEMDHYLSIVIHEFNHSFANRLIDGNLSQLEVSADPVFARVEQAMRQQAYSNTQVMLYEALVRAAVVMYLLEHEPEGNVARRQLREEQHNSFVWLDELVALLQQYERNRSRYPTLASFMPEHNAFYSRLASSIDRVVQAYDAKIPRVEAIEPFANEAQAVDPSLTEIRIRFNRPVDPKKMGIQLGEGGREQMPLLKVIGFTNDNQTLRATLALKPNHPYSFRLRNGGFQSTDGYLSKPYNVSFRTAGK